jgi:capsular exopolysaccharide synthesis family protein
LVSIKILVQDEEKSSGGNNTGISEGDFSPMFNFKSNARNEVQVLKSRHLAEETVKKLKLNVKILSDQGVNLSEVYNEAPFNVDISYDHDPSEKRAYKIELLNNSSFRISNDDEVLDKNVNFGTRIRLNQYNLVITKKPGRSIQGDFVIEIISEDEAVGDLIKRFEAAFSDKDVTTIDLTLNYPHPRKGEVILQELTNLYLLDNLKNKIKNADSTLVFIDHRLALVGNQLSDVEKGLQKYKSNNNIANLEEQSKVLVNDASDYYKKLHEQKTQLTVINDLEKYLKSGENNKIVPSSLSIQDASFASSLERYNQLLEEREQQSLSYTDSNPVIVNIDNQIEGARSRLLQNIESYKNEMELSRQELENQDQSFTNRIQQTPEKERVFLDYSRQQSLKQQLYLYLLQKREEAAISKTSNIGNVRILDNAKSDILPYKPKKSVVYLIGLVMGMVVPLTSVIIRDKLNSKIASKLDVLRLTDTPIIGEISHNPSGNYLVIDENIRSIVGESFRNIRANLQYTLNLNRSNVIMITSSTGGEGKTFTTLNLGTALALTGKKVVFVELDLRTPKLSAYMDVENNIGFSNYVTSDNLATHAIVKPTLFNENCFIVSSGPVPANPSELLAHQKLGHLIEYLKKRFDFIIIDSAPVGLVSDSLIIEKYVDMTLYVLRHRYTHKAQIDIVNELTETEKIKNLYLVINDVEVKKSSLYGYAYNYNYYSKSKALKQLPYRL